MNDTARPRAFGGHRVRVMWERPTGLREFWPLSLLYKPEAIYVFVAYASGSDQAVRVCLRGEGRAPFVIENPLDYDGRNFQHGPYLTAVRYDAEHSGFDLASLFEMLHTWAISGTEDWSERRREDLTLALEQFRARIWHRENAPAGGFVAAD